MLGLALAFSVFASAEKAQADPFAELRAAYAARNAAAAAATYTPDANVIYRYAGSPEERHRGTAAIRASFAALFQQIDPAKPLDLNFRQTERTGKRVVGYYRLRIGRDQVSYGRFDVLLGAGGKFSQDVSTDAPAEAFEESAGPVMLAAENEDLSASYYDALVGRYRLADNCDLVVTRSVRRMFVRNTCTNEWRGLSRRMGREWTAGDRVLSDAATTTYRFAPITNTSSPTVQVVYAARVVQARRRDLYRREAVSFSSRDGTLLKGTVYVPAGSETRRPATVLVHGSGPQDRNGYASIIGVLADALASAGRVVLTYDKRGVGGSNGDWSRAGFDRLADDATAGLTLLAAQPGVDPKRVGLAGSSQAGWVVAEAIRRGARPADVYLLGAAGTALSVAEQNLYNTEVRMRCANVASSDIDLALRQQRAFFAFLADPTRAALLDEITGAARKRSALTDWLFPDSKGTNRDGSDWYTTLDVGFDPLPVWRSYRGRTLFVFAEHDDSTPTSEALRRLRNTSVTTRLLTGSQHLGLRATDKCNAELDDLHSFTPELFRGLEGFAAVAVRSAR